MNTAERIGRFDGATKQDLGSVTIPLGTEHDRKNGEIGCSNKAPAYAYRDHAMLPNTTERPGKVQSKPPISAEHDAARTLTKNHCVVTRQSQEVRCYLIHA